MGAWIATAVGAIPFVADCGPRLASSCPKSCNEVVAACRREDCVGAPGAAIRTLAYVVSECIFAMRPGGAGLRHLASARGMRELPDGKVIGEMVGPGSYSAPAR